MVANTGMLTKPDVVAYVGANASRFGLDPAAVLAVADHEGLNTTPGSVWQLPKEPYKSFGPPSWYGGGAGKPILDANNGDPVAASQWSWTPAGIDYWLQAVSQSGAAGLTGYAAIKQIVGGYGWGFERPADPSADITNAVRVYPTYQKQVQGGVPGVITIPNITEPGNPELPGLPGLPGQPAPGGTQLPTPTNPTDKANPQTQQTTGAKFSLHLFDLPSGPVNLTLPWDFSGILLFLAALFAIIIGALLWKPSRGAITTTVQGAALA